MDFNRWEWLLVAAMVLLSLVVFIFIASLTPLFALIFTLVIISAAMAGWWVISQKFLKVPWWERSEIVEGDQKYLRFIILALCEIRDIPPNFAWVVRRTRGADEKSLTGFYAKRSGWRIIWFPRLLFETVKLFDCRPININLLQRQVNTRSNPVVVDSQVTVWPTENPVVAAITIKEDVRGIVEQFMSALLNYMTAGFEDTELVDLPTAKLLAMARAATDLVNGTHFFKDFGLKVEVRIENIYPLKEVLAAMASVKAAEFGARAAVHQARAIKEIRAVTGLPDKHWANIAFPIMKALEGVIGSGHSGLAFPEMTLKFGGFTGGGEKPAKEKPEAEESKPERPAKASK
ncbi:MAG: SPFH domain-containing protein [Patescibacteria group bacterium]|jgi:hypothetical protein